MTTISVQNPNDDLIGIWHWDTQRDRFRSSLEIYRHFDIDPETAAFGVPIGMILNGVHSEDQSHVRSNVALALQNQDHIDLRFRTISQEHGVRAVQSRGYIFRLPNQQVAFLCGFILDDKGSTSQFDTMVDHLLIAKGLAQGLEDAEMASLIDAVLLFVGQRLASRLKP